jgi:hypothetical protein
MSVQIRPGRPGDGQGMARVWLDAGAYYAGLDPAHFQLPSSEGLAESFDGDLAAKSTDADTFGDATAAPASSGSAPTPRAR